jgi:hypothetical protein
MMFIRVQLYIESSATVIFLLIIALFMYMIKISYYIVLILSMSLIAAMSIKSHLVSEEEKDAVILRVIELNSLAFLYMLAPYQNITQLESCSLRKPSDRSKYLNGEHTVNYK